MIARVPLPNPRCEYSLIPSRQMIIRRYRSIETQRDLHTFFQEGLFSKRLLEFCDDNEGVVDNFATEGGLWAALAVEAGYKNRRADGDVEPVPEDGKIEALKKYHKDARTQYFANAWRIGTDERNMIWETYTRDEEKIEGCAIETTVGQFLAALPKEPGNSERDDSSPTDLIEISLEDLAIGNENCDIKLGACRYQQRWKDEAIQPAGWPGAVSFFKGEDFEIEDEFRLVFNPYSSNILFDSDDRGLPTTPRFDDEPNWRKFPVDATSMANKIIMAPNSGPSQREKVLSWVDEFGLDVGTDCEADIELVDSCTKISQYETHEYLAEIGGNSNYEGTDQHLAEIADSFFAKRDWDTWPIVDIVFLLREPAGGLIEGYWHKDQEHAFKLSEYGYEFQKIWVARFKEGKKEATWRNDKAKEFDDDQGQRALSFSDDV